MYSEWNINQLFVYSTRWLCTIPVYSVYKPSPKPGNCETLMWCARVYVIKRFTVISLWYPCIVVIKNIWSLFSWCCARCGLVGITLAEHHHNHQQQPSSRTYMEDKKLRNGTAKNLLLSYLINIHILTPSSVA